LQLLSLLLFFLAITLVFKHLPVLDHVTILVRVIPVPPIAFALVVEVDMMDHLVSPNVLASVLRSNFARSLDASLGGVGH
jgi:hypothetical protein